MDRIKKVDNSEEVLKEYLGAEGLLEAITRALSYDTKEDIYDYISRMYDIDIDIKE